MNNSMDKKAMVKSTFKSVLALRWLFKMIKNQSNKQFNFNPKRYETKGSNIPCSQETANCTKLKIQFILILRVKKKIPPKNRRNCDQEKTVE